MEQRDKISKSSRNITTKEPCVSASELMTKAEKDGTIKIVDSVVPFKENVILNDISLKAYGMDEDKEYALNSWYRSNIRRGNTVIQVYDNLKRVSSTFFGRRGFEKFFDLRYEYIQKNLGEIQDFDSFGIKDIDQHKELHSVIFGQAQEALEKSNKISVYKLVKANGENAQIAWIDNLQAWLVASKNVSLLARDEKDLNNYQDERYNFAKLIGKEWFRHVDRIQKQGLLSELKAYVNGKTFVGEYCGNQEYQHLVKYTETDIHFVAVVDNDSNATCISPEEAFATFNKFGLTCVKYENMGIYETWYDLNQGLKKIYIDVAKAFIDSEEEGSVLYMVQVDETGKHHVLSLSKLKTLEYRIYRKLREKLRNFLHQKDQAKKPWQDFLRKFKNETEDLCSYIKPPLSLGYYFKVAKEAFEFAETYKHKASLVHDQYITFLSLLMYRMSQDQKLTPASFNEEAIKKVMPIPWTEHSKFYKEKEPEVKLVEDEKWEKSDEAVTGKKVYVIVPMGIPGMGKTYCVRALKKFIEANKCQFSVVSSDEVRKECMERLAKVNKKLSPDELFQKTGTDAKNMFNERVADLIFTSDKRKCLAHFILLDKNHPPNALKGTFDLIKQNSPHLDVEIVALTPLVEKNFFSYEDQGKKHMFPFSANFFFTCLERVQTRKEHETLSGQGVKSANVLVMFFQMFRNVKLNTESVEKNGFQKHLKIPFTAENEPANIPSSLIETLIKVLKATKPGSPCGNENLVAELLEAYLNANLQLKNPEHSYVEEKIRDFLVEKIIPDLDVIRLAKRTSTENQTQAEGANTSNKEEEKKEDFEVSPAVEHYEEYNPTSVPIYLGLFILDNQVKQVMEWVSKGLDQLVETFQNDKLISKARDDLANADFSRLSFIKDLHITSLFIGRNTKKTETEYYKTFKPGYKMHLDIIGFAIVPNKIATAICYPDQSMIKIENKYPHITLMKGKWAPKTSSSLFESLFGRKGPLSEKYHNREFLTLDNFTYRTQVEVNDEKEPNGTAYVVISKPHLKLRLEARASNSHN